jgi:pantetheine-phosphate adenylyltransferase
MNLQTLLDKWHFKCRLSELQSMWNEPHRGYHTTKHLHDLLQQIQTTPDLSEKQREMLMLTALFHDIVYDPTRTDNEERSVDTLYKYASDTNDDIRAIADCIRDTKTHEPRTHLSSLFSEMDMHIVVEPLANLLEWERGIAYEYSFMAKSEYIEKRTQFLKSIVEKYPQNAPALNALISIIQTTS